MIRNVLNILLSFLFLIFDYPVYSHEFTPRDFEKYTLKISNKFSRNYCNTTNFGISKDGALSFSIRETNKEFSKNKLNKFIDYELLNNSILLSLENKCQIFDFPVDELKKLTFD